MGTDPRFGEGAPGCCAAAALRRRALAAWRVAAVWRRGWRTALPLRAVGARRIHQIVLVFR